MGKIYNLDFFCLKFVLYCVKKKKLEINNWNVSLWKYWNGTAEESGPVFIVWNSMISISQSVLIYWEILLGPDGSLVDLFGLINSV